MQTLLSQELKGNPLKTLLSPELKAILWRVFFPRNWKAILWSIFPRNWKEILWRLFLSLVKRERNLFEIYSEKAGRQFLCFRLEGFKTVHQGCTDTKASNWIGKEVHTVNKSFTVHWLLVIFNHTPVVKESFEANSVYYIIQTILASGLIVVVIFLSVGRGFCSCATHSTGKTRWKKSPAICKRHRAVKKTSKIFPSVSPQLPFSCWD